MSPRPRMRTRNVRVSDADWDAAMAASIRRGENLSEVIRECLRAYGRQDDGEGK